MAYQFPPDVEKLVKEQMAARDYSSEDEVLRNALRVFKEYTVLEAQLQADVQAGVEAADRGLARPLDVNALIDRCTLKLYQEGILD